MLFKPLRKRGGIFYGLADGKIHGIIYIVNNQKEIDYISNQSEWTPDAYNLLVSA